MSEVRIRSKRDKYLEKKRQLYASIDSFLEGCYEGGKTGKVTIVFNITQGQFNRGHQVGWLETIG